jgi:hypothetical protein
MVRTTLTLDEDVAVLLERVRKARNQGLKEAINEALRRGLAEMARGERPRAKPYRTPSVSLGRCLVESVDDVAEVLAVAEGDDFK